jgi:hypothetical protein
VTTVTLPDAGAQTQFEQVIKELVDWSLNHLSPEERKDLADRLQEPTLEFESPFAAKMIPAIVEALSE